MVAWTSFHITLLKVWIRNYDLHQFTTTFRWLIFSKPSINGRLTSYWPIQRLVNVEIKILCVVTRKSPSFKVYLLDIPFGQGFKHQTSSVVEVKLMNKDLNSWWIFEDWWRLMKKAIWKLLIKLLWKEALIVWLPFLLQRRKKLQFFSWFRNRGGDLKRSCLHVYSFGMILIQLFQFEILMNITLE